MKKFMNLFYACSITLLMASLESCGGETISANQHIHNYTDVFVEATCEEDGYTKHICECGDTYNDATIKALGHVDIEGKCSRCDKKLYSIGLEYTLSNGFYYITGYTGTDVDVVIPKVYNEIPVIGIGSYAFERCSSLLSIEIPNSVVNIEYKAFWICTNLSTVIFEKESQLTTIADFAFEYCSYLTRISIPSSVTSIGKHAFYRCDSLESITIPFVGETLNGTKNNHFGYIFGASKNNECVPKSLKEVIITGGTNIETSAFYCCSSLTNIEISNSVTSIGRGAFEYCSSLESITIPFVGSSLNEAWSFRFSYIFAGIGIEIDNNYGVPESLKEVIITGGTEIGEYAFERCTSLESITIPSSVTSIDYGAFEYCHKLENLYYNGKIEDWCEIFFVDSSSNPMTLTNDMFILDYNGNIEYNENNYRLLTELVIPSTATYISSYAFAYCSSLKNVVILPGVEKIGGYAFYCCSSLTNIEISNSVQEIGSHAFSSCSLLTSIEIPNSVTSIGQYAFSSCTSLESIIIPMSVNSIGERAFAYCRNLVTITFEQGSRLTSIGYGAFEGCTSLKSIIIPAGVTTISSNTFKGCSALWYVTIPSSVTSIGVDAFSGCEELKKIYYTGTSDQWYDVSVGSGNFVYISGKIECNYIIP